MINSTYLQTVRGAVPAGEFGLILPHEHLFTDLRGPSVPDYAQAEPKDVVQAMLPFLNEAQQTGVTALVECSTIGVGRNVQVLEDLSKATPIHIVVPTGVYRDDYVPEWMRDYAEEEMSQLWIKELSEGIENTSIKAGFIKIAISDDGPRPIEEKILKAAAKTSQQTGTVVASHTPDGVRFKEQWRILDKAGLSPEKFIWVHANLERNKQIHLEAAKIGVYVEFDGVGAAWQSQDAMISYAESLLEAGFLNNILLSHDAGWYQPGRPHGEPQGGYRGYSALVADFIPSLQLKGVSKEEIRQLTHVNPVSAFGLDKEKSEDT